MKKFFLIICTLVLILPTLFTSTTAFAVGTNAIDIDLAPISTTSISGKDALYRLTFKVTGIQSKYENSKLEIKLPDGFSLNEEGAPLSSLLINEKAPTYDKDKNTINYNLGSLASGKEYTYVIKVNIPNGEIKSNVVLEAKATFTADNLSSPLSDAATMKVEASTTSDISISYIRTEDSSGNTVQTPPGGSKIGVWNVKASVPYKSEGLMYIKEGSKVTITNVLPSGLTYVSSSDGGTYNSNTRTITWTFDAPTTETQRKEIESLFYKDLTFKAQFSPSAADYAKYTNTAKISAVLINDTTTTATSSNSINQGKTSGTEGPHYNDSYSIPGHGAYNVAGFPREIGSSSTYYKSTGNPNPSIYNNQVWTTGMKFTVLLADSTVKNLTKFDVDYNIDDNLDLNQIQPTRYIVIYNNYNAPQTDYAPGSEPLYDIYITVNGVEYLAVHNPAGGAAPYKMGSIFTSLGLPADSHVSKLRYNFTRIPAGMFNYQYLSFSPKAGYAGTVRNTAHMRIEGYSGNGSFVTMDNDPNVSADYHFDGSYLSTSSSTGPRTANIVAPLKPGPPTATSEVSFANAINGVVSVGGDTVQGGFTNLSSSPSNLVGPFSSTVILPKGVTVNERNPDYKLASSTSSSLSSLTSEKGSITILDNNYQGTGQQAVLVKWFEDTTVLPGRSMKYSFNVNISADTETPVKIYTYGSAGNDEIKVPSVPSAITDSEKVTDVDDLNDNGKNDDSLIKSGNKYIILSNHKVAVTKQVKGSQDKDFSSFGHVAIGKDIEYKILINSRQLGQSISNFTFMDTLPSVSDSGITTNEARGSQFTVRLKGPIVLPDYLKGKVSVSYSTSKKPSNAELIKNVIYPETTIKLTNPTNSEVPNWISAENVTDWNKIHSYLITFDSSAGSELKDIDEINFTFTARAPTKEEMVTDNETSAIPIEDTSSENYVPENKRAAWNSFAYQENNAQVIEPLKVGVAISDSDVKYGKIYLFKFINDSMDKPEIDSSYKLTNKKSLKGAEFNLLDNDGKVIGTATTDDNGRIIFDNILFGNYTLVETKAPSGYELYKKEINVTISEENNGIALAYAGDDPITRLPDAGGDDNSFLPLVIFSSLSLLGLITFGSIYLFKKKAGNE